MGIKPPTQLDAAGLGGIGLCVFRGVLGGSQDPVAVGGVGVDDGHGEDLRRVVGMLTIGPLDDRRYERLARVQDDERFGVVSMAPSPSIDGADARHDVPAGGQPVVDDGTGELRGTGVFALLCASLRSLSTRVAVREGPCG